MDIPSSSNTSSSDFALYDYLQSHCISSSTSASCFDLALDCLARVFPGCFAFREVEYLKNKVRLLKTFFLYVKMCRRRRNHEALLEHDQEHKDNTV